MIVKLVVTERLGTTLKTVWSNEPYISYVQAAANREKFPFGSVAPSSREHLHEQGICSISSYFITHIKQGGSEAQGLIFQLH